MKWWTIRLNGCPRVGAAFGLHRGVGWFCLHFASNVLWGWRTNAGFDVLWEHWFGPRSLRARILKTSTTSTLNATNTDWTW